MKIFNILLYTLGKNFQIVIGLWREKSDPDLDITADGRHKGKRHLCLTFPDMETIIVSLL